MLDMSLACYIPVCALFKHGRGNCERLLHSISSGNFVGALSCWSASYTRRERQRLSSVTRYWSLPHISPRIPAKPPVKQAISLSL